MVIKWYPKLSPDPHILTLDIHPETLPAGDYTLRDWRDCCVVERKDSLVELHKNLLTSDAARQYTSLEKLADCCSHPVLLIETSPADALRQTMLPNGHTFEPARVIDRLFELTDRLGIQLVWGSRSCSSMGRSALVEIMVRMMLQAALSHEER